MPDISVAPVAELPAATVYRVLALRSRVFVVEQACVFLDADDVDLRPDTLWLVAERAGDVVGTARLVRQRGGDGVGDTLGRIVVTQELRGSGLGAALVRRGLEIARAPLRLSAQARLRGYYERLGFAVCGPEVIIDGMPHLPMRAC